MGEQEKLLRRKVQRNPGPLGALMARIDFQIVDAQLVPAPGRTTQKRTHAGEQFRESEWFHYVIIRAELETFYAIAHAVARSQKNDGRLRFRGTQFFHESPAIFFREHDIDNEKVEPARARRCKPSLAIQREIDGKTGFAEALRQKSRRFLFILDHQNSHKPDNSFLLTVVAVLRYVFQEHERQQENEQDKRVDEL